jgi:hypothetical protein
MSIRFYLGRNKKWGHVYTGAIRTPWELVKGSLRRSSASMDAEIDAGFSKLP